MFRFKSKEEKLRERFAKARGEDYQGLLWSMLPEERKERVFSKFCEEVKNGREDSSAANVSWWEALYDTPYYFPTILKPLGPREAYNMKFMKEIDNKQKALGLKRTFGAYIDVGEREYPENRVASHIMGGLGLWDSYDIEDIKKKYGTSYYDENLGIMRTKFDEDKVEKLIREHEQSDYQVPYDEPDYFDVDDSYSFSPSEKDDYSFDVNELGANEPDFNDSSFREHHDYWYWRNNPAFREWCNDYDVSIDDLDKSGSHVRENAIRDFEGYYYV